MSNDVVKSITENLPPELKPFEQKMKDAAAAANGNKLLAVKLILEAAMSDPDFTAAILLGTEPLEPGSLKGTNVIPIEKGKKP